MVRGFLIFLLLVVLPPKAQAADRLALLIGNQKYAKEVGPLENPHNDIKLVGDALQSLGFEVRFLKDASRVQILTALDQFARDLGAADEKAIGFFYFAGHGIANSSNRRNYLIPTEVQRLNSSSVWHESVSLDEVTEILRQGAPDASHFVIFDACRNELNVREKGIARGFQAMHAGRNMLIAFATAPNESASDEGESGGPYATSLASELVKPIWQGEIFQNVRSEVMRKTEKRQVPWEHSGLESRICFKPCVEVVNPSTITIRKWNMQGPYSPKHSISKNQAVAVSAEIAGISGGRFKIDVLGAGAVAHPSQVLSAVDTGILDAAFILPGDFVSQLNALHVYTGEVPFGLPPVKFVRWMRAEGRKKLNDLYEQLGLGVQSIPCGLMGPKGQWSSRPVSRVDDLKGTKVRFSGLGDGVLRKFGASVATLPGGELIAALNRGLIDGYSFSDPLSDIDVNFAAGSSKYYYYPGWHSPVRMFELIVNRDRWNKLNATEKEVIDYVCRTNIDRSLLDIITNERIGLEAIRREGVTIQPLPNAVLVALKTASDELLEEAAAKDLYFRDALNSYNKFR